MASKFGGVPVTGSRFGGVPVTGSRFADTSETSFLGDIGTLLKQGASQAMSTYQVGPQVISGGVEGTEGLIAKNLTAERFQPEAMRQVSEAFKDEAEAMRQAESWYSRQGLQAIGGAVAEIGKQLVTNPRGVAYFTAEQAANMVPAIVGGLSGAAVGSPAGPVGVVGGATVGAFGASAPMEIGAEFIGIVGGELAARNLAPTEENIKTLLADEQFRNTAISQARVKGATVAAVDAATSVIGGRITSGPMRSAIASAARESLETGAEVAPLVQRNIDALPLSERFAAGAKGYGVDVVGAGVGETAGQVAAYGEADLEEVALEVLGEAGGAIVEVPALGKKFVSASLRAVQPGQAAPVQPGQAAPVQPTPTPDQRLQTATSASEAVQAAGDMIDMDIEALEREAGIADSVGVSAVRTAEPQARGLVAQAMAPAVEPTLTPAVEPTLTPAAEPTLTVDALAQADISAMPAPERQEFLDDLVAARTANLPEQRQAALTRAAEVYGRTVGPVQQPLPRVTPQEAITRAQDLPQERARTAAPSLDALLAADTRGLDTQDREDFNANLAMARSVEPGPVQTAALQRAAEVYGRAIGPVQPRTAVAAEPSRRTAVPRPTNILGRPASEYTQAQLQDILNNDRVPAITRRSVETELRARTSAPVQETISENFIAIPETVPVVAAQPVAGQSAGQRARETAQRAMDTWAASNGVPSPVTFNAAPAELEAGVAEIADLIGSQWGGRVVAFSDTRPGAINGVAIGKVAYVNVSNTQAGVQRTALHEFKHTVEQIAKAEAAAGITDTPAQEFVEQIDSVFDDMTDEGKRAYLENFMAAEELASLQGDARETRVQELLQDPELRSEMVADFLGNRATDKQFWQDLAKADPTGFEGFVKRWLAAIDNLLATLRGAKGKARSRLESAKVDTYIRDLNKAKLTAQSALINYRKATAGQVAPAQEAAPAFSRAQSLVETADLAGATSLAKSQEWARGRDFKVALQRRVLDAAMAEGIDPEQDSPQTREYLLEVGLRDAMAALKQNENAIGWYDVKTRQALAVMSLVHPEIARDENARFAFTWALAVTSNGLKVGKNFELAEKAYEAYKRDGRMPNDVGIGTAGSKINDSLELFNTLRDEWGIDNLRKFMQTSFTVGEISGISKALKPSGEHAEVTVKGAAILGPKIGNGFFSNLYGDFNSLTMDRWLIRTWGRWTGTLIKAMPEQTAKARDRLQNNVRLILADPAEAKRLGNLIGEEITDDVDALARAVQEASVVPQTRSELNKTEVGQELRKAGNSLAKYLDGQKEAPQNPDERKYIRAVFGDILNDLKQTNAYKDLTMADLQAVLWYAEKRLYETAKEDAQELQTDEDVEGYADDSAPDYANAAASVARKKGITDRRINAALKRVEDERSGRARPAAAESDAQRAAAGARQQTAAGGFTRQERSRFIGERAVLRARADRAGDAQQPRAYSGDGGADGGRLRVLKNLGVSYSQVWKASRNLGTVFRANNLTTPEFFELAPTAENAAKFQQAISDNKASHRFGAAVYVYPAEDYQQMRLFITKDGKSGVAVKPDGDIVSVFSTGGAGRAIMELAVSAGGRKLDAFDTILPEFYAPHGFRAVARTRWNDEVARDTMPDWDKNTFRDFNSGEPDVVFMVYDPAKMDAEYSRKDGRVVEEYDRAVAIQKRNTPRFSRAQADVAARIPELEGGYDGAMLIDAKTGEIDQIIAVRPNQIKSAIGNRGTFDRGSPDIRFSRAQQNLMKLYSALARAADNGPVRAPAAQWKGLLRKQAKPEEITWSGVEDWLDLQEGNVPREAVTEFLSKNGVQVGEVVLGRADVYPDDFLQDTETGRAMSSDDWEREFEESGIDPLEAFGQLVPVGGEPLPGQDATEYDQYTLPGGTNYREVLITLPAEQPDEKRLETFRQKMRDRRITSEEREEYRRLAIASQRAASQRYVSSHWRGVPNVLAHVRMNDRVDADGARVLFVEELQSDWAQEGRKKGFVKGSLADADMVATVNTSATEPYWEVRTTNGVFVANVLEFDPARSTPEQAIAAARRLAATRQLSPRGVPAAPFVQSTNSWLNLALKRVITMAVEEGYDKIAFINGKQSAERYDLGQQLSEIVILKNEFMAKGFDDFSVGILRAYDLNGDEVFETRVNSIDDIESYIGKETAKKLLEAPTQDTIKYGLFKAKVLAGDDLFFGGEGMREFYDSIVPKAVAKLLPKIGGGKLETVSLPTGSEDIRIDVFGDGTASVESGNMTLEFDTVEEAEAFRREAQAVQPYSGFAVTPQMTDQVMDAGLPLFSRAQNIFGQPMPAATWQIEDSVLDSKVVYRLQDKLVDTKRVVEAINDAVGQIEDKWDPYLQEKLYHGVVAKQTKDFATDELKPLIELMGRNKVTLEEFDKYLHNRHAEERNIAIAQRNPALPDAGSGIPTADARAFLAALPPARRALLEGAARKIDSITKVTRDILISSGLEAQSTIDAWDALYKKYVPLMREELDYEGSRGAGTGRGVSVRGSSSRRAVGSADRRVVDIMANIAMQRERAIVRANKNKVSQALYGLALKNPSPDFWLPINPDAIKDPQALTAELINFGVDPKEAENIAKEPRESYVDPRTGLVSTRVNRTLRNLPNVVHTRVNGKDRFLILNNKNPRAERMANALNNMDVDSLNAALSIAAVGTRWFASVNTQYNPIFGIINFTRDVGAGALNLSTTPLADKKARVIADTIPALRGIYGSLRGGSGQSQWAALWDEFQKVGGQTGFRDQFSQSEERARALQKELDNLSAGDLKKAGQATLNWLSDYNTAMENAVRLSAYKAALDKGLSKQRAAELAKDLTVNFNKKGAAATNMGALFAFFNASVQGTTRLAQTLRGPAGKKIIYGGLLLGAVQAVALMAAGFEEDEPPGFVKERNIVIPIGGGDYLTWPMPLGFNVIPNVGRIATEWALSGFENSSDRAIEMITSFFDMFNPIGNAGISMQTLSPTVFDPLVALSENKDWTGSPISREDMSGLSPTPGYLRARDSASVFTTEVARFFNLATGGTDFTPGKFSPTPEQLEYLAAQLTGGVGREVGKTVKTAEMLLSGEELPAYTIPLGGRLYGQTTGSAAESNRFYNNVRQMNLHNAELNGLRERRQSLQPYFRENPDARLIDSSRAAYRQVQALRNRKRDLLERKASREEIRRIEQQITNRMKQFNDRVSRIES